MTTAGPIEPDTKDWTWVLDRPCPECGFAAAEVAFGEVGEQIRANARTWQVALAGPRATGRPAPTTWSVTEYAAHVRDVHRVFAERVRLMLEHDQPLFDSWDQDAAALADRYDLQDPADVGATLMAAADEAAARYDAALPEQLSRRGRRSNGSEFTVDSIARYHLHDVVHHLWDVRAAVTVAAYDHQATAYREASAGRREAVTRSIVDFAARLQPGARVLEIGSGGGRDALDLEAAGLSVRRTDVTRGFVALLRAAGYDADVLDPLTDALIEDPTDDRVDGSPKGGSYDGVWANASLLHVARADLPTVLANLAAATRPGGVLRLSVKQGDGEAWSTHGSVDVPRMFTYWRAPDLSAALATAGWDVEETEHGDGTRGERWLMVTALRRP